jgi:hypothetical protein
LWSDTDTINTALPADKITAGLRSRLEEASILAVLILSATLSEFLVSEPLFPHGYKGIL